MTTCLEFIEMLRLGRRPVVTFAKSIEDLEGYAEPGMRARAIAGSQEGDGVVKVTFDFSEFDAHNIALESPNYYDKAGAPTLTAREAGFYKPQEEYFLMVDDGVSSSFAIEPDERTRVHERFKASGSQLSYVAWLEDEVLRLEAK